MSDKPKQFVGTVLTISFLSYVAIGVCAYFGHTTGAVFGATVMWFFAAVFGFYAGQDS